MGVWGLTSLIEQHPSLLTRYCLHNERLVIDGDALRFNLYNEEPLCDDGRHGGRYQNFASKCRLFFLILDKCKISPYLVFDGANEKDDKKLTTMKSRKLSGIQAVIAISSGSRMIATSPCTRMVFLQVLEDVGIPYAFCEFEADAEIAALANTLNCAAASNDSDFCILDLKAGYLPLAHLDWINPKKVEVSGAEAPVSPGQFYIECKKYSRNAFCTKFNVKQALLPMLATAVGNDYKDIFGTFLDQFYRSVRSRFSQSKSGKGPRNRIATYLSWLSEMETVDEAIGDMIEHVEDGDRPKLRERIQASLEMYDVSKSSTISQFRPTGGQLDPLHSKLSTCISVPPWFVTLVKEGKVPSECVDVLCSKRVFFAIQVEDSSQPSAGVASLHIRSVLYGILLQKQRSMSTRPPCVEEYAQWAGGLECTTAKPVYEIDRGDGQMMALPSLEDIPLMSEPERSRVFHATVGVEGSVIFGTPALFKLATCVTIYLLHHAEPPFLSDQVVALIVSWLHGVAVYLRFVCEENDTLERLRVGLDNSDVQALLTNCEKYEKKYKEYKKLDLEVVQAMAQWQQCLLDLVTLNKILLNPVPPPDMSVLYNGPLIHSMCSILKSMSPAEQRQWVMEELLRGTRRSAHVLFDQLLQPTLVLLTQRKKSKKSKAAKRTPSGGGARPLLSAPSQRDQRERGKEDSVSEKVTYQVDVSNRFAPLTLDD